MAIAVAQQLRLFGERSAAQCQHCGQPLNTLEDLRNDCPALDGSAIHEVRPSQYFVLYRETPAANQVAL